MRCSTDGGGGRGGLAAHDTSSDDDDARPHLRVREPPPPSPLPLPPRTAPHLRVRGDDGRQAALRALAPRLPDVDEMEDGGRVGVGGRWEGAAAHGPRVAQGAQDGRRGARVQQRLRHGEAARPERLDVVGGGLQGRGGGREG